MYKQKILPLTNNVNPLSTTTTNKPTTQTTITAGSIPDDLPTLDDLIATNGFVTVVPTNTNIPTTETLINELVIEKDLIAQLNIIDKLSTSLKWNAIFKLEALHSLLEFLSLIAVDNVRTKLLKCIYRIYLYSTIDNEREQCKQYIINYFIQNKQMKLLQLLFHKSERKGCPRYHFLNTDYHNDTVYVTVILKSISSQSETKVEGLPTYYECDLLWNVMYDVMCKCTVNCDVCTISIGNNIKTYKHYSQTLSELYREYSETKTFINKQIVIYIKEEIDSKSLYERFNNRMYMKSVSNIFTYQTHNEVLLFFEEYPHNEIRKLSQVIANDTNRSEKDYSFLNLLFGFKLLSSNNNKDTKIYLRNYTYDQLPRSLFSQMMILFINQSAVTQIFNDSQRLIMLHQETCKLMFDYLLLNTTNDNAYYILFTISDYITKSDNKHSSCLYYLDTSEIEHKIEEYFLRDNTLFNKQIPHAIMKLINNSAFNKKNILHVLSKFKHKFKVNELYLNDRNICYFLCCANANADKANSIMAELDMNAIIKNHFQCTNNDELDLQILSTIKSVDVVTNTNTFASLFESVLEAFAKFKMIKIQYLKKVSTLFVQGILSQIKEKKFAAFEVSSVQYIYQFIFRSIITFTCYNAAKLEEAFPFICDLITLFLFCKASTPFDGVDDMVGYLNEDTITKGDCFYAYKKMLFNYDLLGMQTFDKQNYYSLLLINWIYLSLYKKLFTEHQKQHIKQVIQLIKVIYNIQTFRKILTTFKESDLHISQFILSFIKEQQPSSSSICDNSFLDNFINIIKDVQSTSNDYLLYNNNNECVITVNTTTATTETIVDALIPIITSNNNNNSGATALPQLLPVLIEGNKMIDVSKLLSIKLSTPNVQYKLVSIILNPKTVNESECYVLDTLFDAWIDDANKSVKIHNRLLFQRKNIKNMLLIYQSETTCKEKYEVVDKFIQEQLAEEGVVKYIAKKEKKYGNNFTYIFLLCSSILVDNKLQVTIRKNVLALLDKSKDKKKNKSALKVIKFFCKRYLKEKDYKQTEFYLQEILLKYTRSI